MDNRPGHRKAPSINDNSEYSKSQGGGSGCDKTLPSEEATSDNNNTTNNSTMSNELIARNNDMSNVKDLSDDILPFGLMKNLQRKNSSTGSAGGGSGNNSDNSALVSLGNNSFGFNFDSEETLAANNSPSDPSEQNDSEGDNKDDDNNNDERGEPDKVSQSADEQPSSKTAAEVRFAVPLSQPTEKQNNNFPSGQKNAVMPSADDNELADAAVQNLKKIIDSSSTKWKKLKQETQTQNPTSQKLKKLSGRKRENNETNSDGYDSDIDATPCITASSTITPHVLSSTSVISAEFVDEKPAKKKAKKQIDESKREERNAREKERSFRITKQINELRDLLSSGGVIVPKGTKSSVLTEAANYIRLLQQHQYRSELERHRLLQQLQMIGTGSLGPQAANTVRHVAAQNGVWTLGNFGGLPPRSAMSFHQKTPMTVQDGLPVHAQVPQPAQTPEIHQTQKIEPHEYRNIFNTCAVAMAIASMGGAFIDCNQLFIELSGYTKQEVCALTIFNLTSRADLQSAFDIISQMISQSADRRITEGTPPPCLLRGTMKNRMDLGLSVALVKGDDGVAKCFCVTLVKDVTSPYALLRPIPVTVDSVHSESKIINQKTVSDNMPSPTFTTG